MAYAIESYNSEQSSSFIYLNSRNNDSYSLVSFVRQSGVNTPRASITGFVSILEHFGIPGPQHLTALEDTKYYERIGEGAQFSVYKRLEMTGVVMKRIVLKPQQSYPAASHSNYMKNTPDNGKEFEPYLDTLELEIRSLCHHQIRQNPNIVKLNAWAYDYSDYPSRKPLPVLMMEQANCTLATAFRREQLSANDKIQLCLDMASGLQCLFECGIVHGDLKPDNVLLFKQDNPDQPWLAKLADFGLSIALEKKDTKLTFSRYRSTLGWQPPETIGKERREPVEPDVLHKCDSYGFGLLALSTLILEGTSPMDYATAEGSTPDFSYVESKLEGTVGLTLTEKMRVEKLVRTILQKFLLLNPKQRSSVDPKLFLDDSQVCSSWKLNNEKAKIEAATRSQNSQQRRNFHYWSHLDPALLDRLCKDLDSNKQGQPSGDLLLGLALASSVQFMPDRAQCLRYFRQAACGQLPNKIALGVLDRIYKALQHEVADQSGDNADFVVSDEALATACSDGSWIAGEQLAARGTPRLLSALQKHRDNGGYNPERISDFEDLPENRDKTFEIDGVFVLPVTLDWLRQADIAYFAGLPNKQLSETVIDMRGNTMLHVAAMLGRVDVIRLIAQWVSDYDVDAINRRNAVGETPLYKACAAGQSHAIKELIHLGADAKLVTDPETGSAISCLHWLFLLAEEHMDEIAHLLVRAGAQVSARTAVKMQYGTRTAILTDHFPFHWPHGTPLHWAVHVGSLEAARILLEHGARIDEDDTDVDKYTHTPLALAMQRADSRMVHFLLERGADCNKIDGAGFSVLHALTSDKGTRNFSLPKRFSRWCYHGSWHKSLEEVRGCVQAIKNHGGNLDARTATFQAWTPLLEAARSADSAAIIALLEAGADAQLGGSEGLPLHVWLRIHPSQVHDHHKKGSYWTALDALLANTVDWTQTAPLVDDTIFHVALQSPITSDPQSDTQVIQQVTRKIATSDRARQQGLDIDTPNRRGETPLLWAARIRSDNGKSAVELTRFLASMGATHAAARDNREDFIHAVVMNIALGDAQRLQMIQDHLYGLGIAEEDVEGRRAVLNASVDTRTGHTALMGMIEHTNLACVRYALHLGVNVNAATTTAKAVTALDLALERADDRRSWLLEEWMNNNIGPPEMEAIDAQKFLFGDKFFPRDREHGIRDNLTSRDLYFASATIIQELLENGAKKGSRPDGRLRPGPRETDRFIQGCHDMAWFVREKQPFYKTWKILYDYDDEQDDANGSADGALFPWKYGPGFTHRYIPLEQV